MAEEGSSRHSWPAIHYGRTWCTSIHDKNAVVEGFYGGLFAAEDEQLPDWIFEQWSFEALENLRTVDSALLREILEKGSLGKTCAEDQLVWEMFLQCDNCVCWMKLLSLLFYAS